MRPARASLGLSAFLLAVLLFFGYPLVMLVAGSLRTGQPGTSGSWSPQAFTSVYASGATWHEFGYSVLLATSVALIGLVAGFLFAYLVTRTNTPLRQLVTPVMVASFAIPLLFFAISWGLLTSQGGLVTQLFGHGSDGKPLISAFGWPGLIGVSGIKTISVMYLLLLGPVRAMNRSYEEASLIAGAGRVRTFFRINIPILMPALSGLLVLGFVVGLGQLDVPLLLGTPAGITVFSTGIYQSLSAAPVQYNNASALALLLVAITGALIVIQRLATRNRSYVTVTGKGFVRDRIDIGRWKWLGTAAIVGYLVAGIALPVAQLAVTSLQPFLGVNGHWTLSNYTTLFADPQAGQAIGNTIVIGVVGGFVASCLALAVSYLGQRSRSRLAKLPDAIIWLVVGVPGLVLALAIAWAYLSAPGLKTLYGTVWLVLIALVVSVAPVATRATGGAVAQLGAELEEAARVSGASSPRMIASVVVPLIAPSFLASWFITGVIAAGNLDIPILLSGPNSTTVSLLVYNFYNQIGATTESAALLMVMLGFFIAALAAAALARLLVRLAARSHQARGVVGQATQALRSIQGGGTGQPSSAISTVKGR